MHTCKYCNKPFYPRPQVKNPKACNNPECQKKRQRENERVWHSKNKAKFDAAYHRVKRKIRNKAILKVFLFLIEALRVGLTMYAKTLDTEAFENTFKGWFLKLGLRQINKLWSDEYG